MANGDLGGANANDTRTGIGEKDLVALLPLGYAHVHGIAPLVRTQELLALDELHEIAVLANELEAVTAGSV